MRLWRWIINDLYRKIIADSLRKGTQLFDALDRLEQTADGYPQEGQYSLEDQSGDIVRWQVASHEILYERIVDGKFLLMAAIEADDKRT